MEKLLYSGYIKVVENNGYEYIKEKDMVWIIPILRANRRLFLGLREEMVPPYGDGKYLTIMSGTLDKKGEKPEEAALRELQEEAGIIPRKYRIKAVFENIPIYKTTSVRTTIYFMDIKQFEKVKAEGDGSTIEKNSKTVWFNLFELDDILDKYNKYDVLSLFAINYAKNMIPKLKKKVLVERPVSLKRKFVLHEHKAKRAGLHYDLRIENDNHKLWSWAIRKGLPLKAGVKHLAIQQPNHNMEWLKTTGYYAGENSKNTYGQGTYKILTHGTLNIVDKSKDNIVFEITNNSKYRGKYVLHRMHNDQWIIFKTKSNGGK